MVNNFECLSAEKISDDLLKVSFSINGEIAHYEVPFGHLTPGIIGFDFPEEIRRILRVANKDVSITLVRLLSRVAEGLSVTLPATLIETPVLA